MSDDIQARKMTEAQLIDRAIKDPAFRAELVADPKAVFARELGLEMPDSIVVEVLQETPSTVYLVLPQAVAAVGAELSEAELESVAGGWTRASECGTCNPHDSDCVQSCPAGPC